MNKLLQIIGLLVSFTLTTAFFYVGPPTNTTDSFDQMPPDAELVIGITHVTLGDVSDANDIFWDYTEQVLDSLETSHDGYLGHRVRIKVLSGEGWTMSMWQSEEALNQFVRSDIHSSAMSAGMPAVKKARFVRITLPRNQAPLSWDQMEELMSTQGRVIY